MNEQPVITEKLKNVKLSDDIVLSIDISQVGNVKTVNGIEPISGDIHLPVDSAISYESENPIQNKAVSLKMKDDQDLYFDILERNTGLIFIKDVEDLLKLKQYVDDGEETSAKYYLQVRDIDLSGIAWEGIGLYADGGANMRQFRGTYNGGGYKISNLKFKTPCDDVGFFNCAANGAAIKNMEIHLDGNGFDIGDLSVNSNYKTKAELDAATDDRDPNALYWVTEDTSQKYAIWKWDGSKFSKYNMGAGVLVGYVLGHVAVDNVKTYGTLGSEYIPGSHNCAGMIVGSVDNSGKRMEQQTPQSGLVMTNCESNVDVFCTYTKSAGLVAYNINALNMKDCTNNGNITNFLVSRTNDSGGTGGIVGFDGYSPYGKTWLENITSAGEVTGKLTIDDIMTYNIGSGQQGHGSITGCEFQYPQLLKNIRYRNGQVAQFGTGKGLGYSVLGDDGYLHPTESPDGAIQTCEHWDGHGDPEKAAKKNHVLKLTGAMPSVVIDQSVTKNTCAVWQDIDKNWHYATVEDLGDNKVRLSMAN